MMNNIYLDNQATTACDERVLAAMMPYFSTHYANPHAAIYEPATIAKQAVETAREQIAIAINANPDEIIFTSGATESNNLAIKGVANFYKNKGNRIITSSIEHKCLLEACISLKNQGFEIVFIQPKNNGIIDPNDIKNAINDQTILVSIMHVNNEIGTIQPIEEINQICNERGVFFHTDAAQALGKIDVDAKNCNLMSLSAHKIYGPKGIGALYVSKNPRVRLTPIIHGGGQERGMRSGTISPALCAGFGKACELIKDNQQQEYEHIKKMRDIFHETISTNLTHVSLNGDFEKRIVHNLNYSFFAVEGESLILNLQNICVSTGSACTSDRLDSSYVLNAIGVDEGLAHSSIRISFGRFNTINEIEIASKKMIECVNQLRQMSPLWEE